MTDSKEQTTCKRCREQKYTDKIHFCSVWVTREGEKEQTAWQTVYEQLQEIERIDKVLEDMENIKFHCDMRYCNWEECKQQLKQSILIHIPTK